MKFVWMMKGRESSSTRTVFNWPCYWMVMICGYEIYNGSNRSLIVTIAPVCVYNWGVRSTGEQDLSRLLRLYSQFVLFNSSLQFVPDRDTVGAYLSRVQTLYFVVAIWPQSYQRRQSHLVLSSSSGCYNLALLSSGLCLSVIYFSYIYDSSFGIYSYLPTTLNFAQLKDSVVCKNIYHQRH